MAALVEFFAQSNPPRVAQPPRMPLVLVRLVSAMFDAPKLTTPSPEVMAFSRSIEVPLVRVTVLRPSEMIVEATTS